ncbi:LacI family DNA-binding transcriptional regulator [Litorihabitans aurantiacus]|uniref:LacI family transcriptional regulator n=1 Tax=Litorihabitans aurantiacus TaxID=1930061 RepID=A0AA37XEQ0_9MICO|nr:LacI family DNA-binding transcriptional regulator [Litorihabitans aurantiacus]GMA31814.1 LacI family transcriptional regulator [Litorihabitans aurantiacus]
MPQQLDLPPRATLAQVADRAGVSLKTASRALGGEPYVRDGTRQAVLTAARELGYRRNVAASLLARGRVSETVGLITGSFANPFYSALAQGIEDAVREHGLLLSVASSGEEPEREWELARHLAEHQSKAIVVASAMPDHEPYAGLVAAGTPVTFVDRRARGVASDSVVFADVEGGRLAARHLLRHGHRRIAFIGDYEWLPTQLDRLAGVADELATAGLEPVAPWTRLGLHDAGAAHAHVAAMLRAPEAPTAVIAGNNRILLGLVEALTGYDAGPPPATIGFDDVDWARAIGQTVIVQDPIAMGRTAGALVLARLDDPDLPVRTEVIGVDLVARGSGERPPRVG